MTDHRITDLSYGHLGEFIYDPDGGEWVSSINSQNALDADVLQPFGPCIAPSIRAIPERKQIRSDIARLQSLWLVKNCPEVFPANVISTTLAQEPSAIDIELSSNVGSLLEIGRAADIDRVSGSRKPQILAMPCGEAGHILRLIRPCIESYGWGKQSAVRASLMDPACPDQGYWVGTGGVIRQISFADDAKGSGTWLAVRQAATTTIFRPMYGEIPATARSFHGHQMTVPSSNLDPNPVVTLEAERTCSKCHVDVSFNPWYPSQFAVIDQHGRWSIWDVEGLEHRNPSFELVPGRSGQIYDGHIPDPGLKMAEPDLLDGWHRILWVSGVKTLAVCNRRHLAVFDVKGTPTRLDCPEFLAADNSDSILDVKRSPANLSHLFVLTTSRVFWIGLTPACEQGDSPNGYVGAKVILSYRHFRDGNDETMKLAVVNDERVSILISSGTTNLINFYCFSETENTTGRPSASQGSFTLPTDLEYSFKVSLQNILFVPVPLMQGSSKQAAGPELQYIEHEVKFFQLWALTSDLGMWSTLCSMRCIGSAMEASQTLKITAPTTKLPHSSSHTKSRRVVNDPFIVPDELDDELLACGASVAVKSDERSRRQVVDDLRFGMNWTGIFQSAFVTESQSVQKNSLQTKSPDSSPKLAELLRNVEDRINHAKAENSLGMTTFFELSGFEDILEDLDQASAELLEFLEFVQQDLDPDAPSTLVLTKLTHSVKSSTDEPRNPLDMLKVYDALVEVWMASLPLEVPGSARLSKFKTIRKIAVELYLSSIALSMSIKASQVPTIPDKSTAEMKAVLQLDKIEAMPRDISAAFSSSQFDSMPSQDSDLSLPTPTRTPSEHSHESTTTTRHLPEDPAISRLRQYAVSIKSVPDAGKSKLLSHWPSSLGANPARYSWEAAKKASVVAENGEEGDYRTRREKARRRRRTEKFLSREGARATEVESLPTFIATGSQPQVAHHTISSQTVDEEPMTQPDRGAFGSRSAQKAMTKKKPRRAGF